MFRKASPFCWSLCAGQNKKINVYVKNANEKQSDAQRPSGSSRTSGPEALTGSNGPESRSGYQNEIRPEEIKAT